MNFAWLIFICHVIFILRVLENDLLQRNELGFHEMLLESFTVLER